METYTVSVTYGDGEPQDTEGLKPDQAAQGVAAFLRDMFGLPGSAVTAVAVRKEQQ
jgi:hypothetical protein